ncbi:MAG: hypothetical protein H6741_17500 [Alphaproteobacteria bacterium]|nr:hypothetical protein [Alphaproteobacteria bacterium]MCB9794514.1 hypothetical protein [Alphaproteobacteria bacterium]
MSYDLFFTPPKLAPSKAEIIGWLNRSRHVQVSENQAWYENRDTGVYFGFDFAGGKALPAFNINYFRPHTFGLEAAPFLAAFVEAFGLGIQDPQSGGMGEGAFSQEGFLRGWNHGNDFAHRAMIAGGHVNAPQRSLPQDTLTRVWRWNLAKEAHQDWSGSIEMRACWVPTVFLFADLDDPARVRTGLVWGEAMSITLPAVDLIVAVERSGAPPVVIEVSEIQDLLEGYETGSGDARFKLDGREWAFGLDHHVLDYDDPPQGLLQAFLARGRPGKPQRLSPDSVLTRELLEAAGG